MAEQRKRVAGFYEIGVNRDRAVVQSSLSEGVRSRGQFGARSGVTGIQILTFGQALLAALLPKCPVCLASYIGASSSVGLLRGLTGRTLFWVTLASMTFGVAAFLYNAFVSRRPKLAIAGIVSVGMVLAGKNFPRAQFLFYPGLILFLAASILNVVIFRTATSGKEWKRHLSSGGTPCCR
jgi:hypothetical protein